MVQYGNKVEEAKEAKTQQEKVVLQDSVDNLAAQITSILTDIDAMKADIEQLKKDVLQLQNPI